MPPKATAWDVVAGAQPEWSAWNRPSLSIGETAWREYLSADFYAELLTREGFAVERGTGGMPTAFRATWSNGGSAQASSGHRRLCRV